MPVLNPGGIVPPVKKKTVAKKPAVVQPKPPAPGSFAALYAQAGQLAQQQVNAQLASIAAQQAEAKKASDKAAALEAAKGGAYSLGLQKLGLAPAIQNLYQGAGNTQAALAQGFSGDIRTQADADAAAQRNMLAGTGQEGAVRNQGEAMGNVNYALNGYYPATELNLTGSALAAQAALQPGFASQFGQIAEAAKRKEFTDTEIPKFTDLRAQALATRPDLQAKAFGSINDFAQQQIKNQMDYRALLDSEQQLGIKNRGDIAAITGIDPVTGKPAVTQYAPKSTIVRSLANGQLQAFDPLTGQPIGAAYGPKKTAKGGKKNGLTAYQYSQNQQKGDTEAKTGYYGMVANAQGKLVPAYTVAGFDAENPDTWGAPQNYQTLLKTFRNKYKLSLADAQATLDAYYPPGENGRPAFSFQERTKLRKAGVSAAAIRHVQDLYNVGSADHADQARALLLTKLSRARR